MAAPIEVILSSELSGQLWNICVWDPKSGTSLVTYKAGASSSRSLCVLGGEYLISAVCNKPLLHLWNVQRRDQTQLRMACGGIVTAMACSENGKYCAAAMQEKLYVWQVSTGNLLAVISRHYQTINCIKFTEDGNYIVTGGEDNMVLVWTLSSIVMSCGASAGSSGVEPLHMWTSHSLPVTDIHVGVGGMMSRVYTASMDQTVKVWELASGQLLCSLVFEHSVTSIAVDNAECAVFAGCSNGEIYQALLFQRPVRVERHVADDEGESAVFSGHTKKVTCLALSMDGTQLVSGSADTAVRVWDVRSHQCVRVLPHKGAITNLLMIMTPPNMNNPESKPTLPIQSFKRHLHGTPGAESLEGAAEKGVVTVLLKPNKIIRERGDSHKNLAPLTKKIRTEESGEKTAEQVEAELQTEVSRLRTINKQIFDYSVTKILNGHDTGSAS